MARVYIDNEGVVEEVLCPGGICHLEAGDNVQLQADEGLAVLKLTDNLNNLLHYYQRNYKAIIEGIDIGDFKFHDENTLNDRNGYYISKINNTAPYMYSFEDVFFSNFSLLGGPTYRITTVNNEIRVKDIARPDVDCADYIEVYQYLHRLRQVLDGIKNQIIENPSEEGDKAIIYGVQKQYQALQYLWNFLVTNLSLVVNATYQETSPTEPKGKYPESKIYIQIRLHNNTDIEHTIQPIYIHFTALALGEEGSSLKLKFDNIIKVKRSTSNDRITFDLTSPSGGLLPLISTGTWVLTPKSPPPIIVPDEEISVLFSFILRGVRDTSGVLPLPKRLGFTIDTEIPDVYARAESPSSPAAYCKVHRYRDVYIPTTQFTVTELP